MSNVYTCEEPLNLDQDQPSKSRDPGVKCLLYEARKSLKNQETDESKLLEHLKEINPKMALAQVMTPRSETTPLLKTNYTLIRSDEGLTLETSALYSLRWPIYIFNLVDTTKLC